MNKIEIGKYSDSTQKIIFVFMALVIIGYGLLFFGNPFRGKEGVWEPITHPQYGFTIDYPTKWIVHKYDDGGYRGESEVKLRVYPREFGDSFIVIYHRKNTNSDIERVAAWSELWISKFRDNDNFMESSLQLDEINGHQILRREIQTDVIYYHDVYISRNSDEFIIRLKTNPDKFEMYLDEYEAIVASFRPLG